MKKLIILALVFLFFCSCGAVDSRLPEPAESTSAVTENNAPQTETTEETAMPAEEYVPRYFPESEEKLVYAVPKGSRYDIHPRTVDEINFYLRSLGKPYYIELIELDCAQKGELTKALGERFFEGLQTDLITATGAYGDDIKELAKVCNALDLSKYMTDELYSSLGVCK